MKQFLMSLPGPDLMRRPIMIMSGRESLNMINGDRKKMQVLVSGSTMPMVGQAGVSYTDVQCTNQKHLNIEYEKQGNVKKLVKYEQTCYDLPIKQRVNTCHTEFVMDFCTT